MSKPYLQEQLLTLMRQLEVTSLPVHVNSIIGERDASILLDEFKTQL